ncbi:hypothetical protein KHM83_05725 [Fusibacter paucivorans]|uniref:HTH domain-containing protein n=1 Tax=Fusibacter paucivorans TaxID=76009 RepID=A0ABS5PMP8_9FIRM|nr:hypothetical protein [Fusibacter paucivorans]MBS7526167.1 hypothetical protein [Fusibacter paucivorans]
MNIGFLGSEKRLKYIREVVDTLFTDIHPTYIVDELAYYNEETAAELKALRNDLQGIIFAGELQYEFYNSIFFPNIPCDYVKKDWSSLQNAFLSMSIKGIDFRNVSIDSYSYSSIFNLLKDLGTLDNAKAIKIIQRRQFDKGYVDSVFDDHYSYFKSGAVKGCITALHPVLSLLEAEGVPCVYARPTTEIIIKTINGIVDLFETQYNKDGHIAILILQIIPKKEYSYIRQDEYLYMHEKIKVAEEVYYFAKNTHAAVVSESIDKFMILMNKETLIDYTNGLQRFYLLNSIFINTNCDVNIAVGYGFNPSEAKFNANLAAEKFDADSKNLTYIVPRQNAAIGPLNFLVGDDLNVDRIEEDYISSLSKEIGISQTMLYKLYSMIERQKRNSCTSQDLADKLSISQRNANRLLRKLEDFGYAKVVGKRLTGQSGRPSDIYDISLSK